MNRHNYLQELMGCELNVSIFSGDVQEADLAFADIYLLGQKIEREFSRFLPDSALSQLNRDKEITPSQTFRTVFTKAKKLYEETDKIFNPTIRLDLLGYDKDFSQHQTFTAKEGQLNTDFSQAKLTDKITLPPNQKLDFGGFLKGYFCDLAIQNLPSAIVNLGGDIRTTGEPRDFQIYNPINKQSITVSLQDQALATSGTYKRKWKDKAHILTDKNQNPDSDLASVSIIATNAETADAYATAAFILGSKKATELLKRKKLDYIFVQKDGNLIQTI